MSAPLTGDEFPEGSNEREVWLRHYYHGLHRVVRLCPTWAAGRDSYAAGFADGAYMTQNAPRGEAMSAPDDLAARDDPVEWKKRLYRVADRYGICGAEHQSIIAAVAALSAKDAEITRLRAALSGVMDCIDRGMLVRDTSNDLEQGWALRQLSLVMALKAANDCLARPTGT
jgi:hypothetical protein